MPIEEENLADKTNFEKDSADDTQARYDGPQV